MSGRGGLGCVIELERTAMSACRANSSKMARSVCSFDSMAV
jgi:hypothetical protein